MIRILPLNAPTLDLTSAMAAHTGDKTLLYKQVGNQKLCISLYNPPHFIKERVYPLLMLIHGGGWNSRRIFEEQTDWAGDYLGFLGRYFANRGYICASVDYRLMQDDGQRPSFELMDLYDDCSDAAAYLKENAEKLRIDIQRTAVLGESAGGHLAAALITLPWHEKGFFKTAILVNAICDMHDPRWRTRVPDVSAHPLLLGKTMEEKVAMLSPTDNIDQSTCPTLLLHGTEDSVVFPFHAHKFHDLLRAREQEARLDFIEHTNHAFLLAEYMQLCGKPLDAVYVSIASIETWLSQMFN